ncbi:uncharacterized protein LOC135843980 [Planococcus citri]|uniref:uncharacterized protein LOC135843980 n=1 Tax=Planococcus citri TaxID=170843 RepID=UPI0031F97069
MKASTQTIDTTEDLDRKITDNKRKIKILNDINAELVTRKTLVNRVKFFSKEAEDLEKELKEIQRKVNNAWNEKIRVEQGRTAQLESEWKALQAKIEANADTPGYHQAIKHNEIQLGQHKHDGPSTRTNYKNMAVRLQNEIKTLQQRVNASKLSLINEIKKKTALEEEVREVRTNMSHRRSVTPSKLISTSIPDLNLHTSARIN